jgi:hypothetical protein
MLPRMRVAIACAVLVVACGAEEDVSVVSDGAVRDAAALPGDVADVQALPDAAPSMDVAPDRTASVDARADTTPDAARDAGVDVLSVPLPAAVAPGAECYALLTRIGMVYTRAGPSMGIVDPVTVSMPINGVNFHGISYDSAARPLLMDCRLAVALWHLTTALRTRWNVTDLVHLGIYNYRVIAGTTTLSQHSYATAIDLADFRTADGTTHSVARDFTMNGQPTCPPRTTSARDRLLKEVACWMYDSRVFHTILTPNYNDAHRDHFHCDLTTGAHTIRLDLPGGVDPEHHPFFDLFMDDH